MAERDEDSARLRPGPPRDHGSAHAPRFVNRVLKASTRVGGSFGRHPTTGRVQGRATSGRGAAAARLAGRHLDHRARRVVMKTRLVNRQRAGADRHSGGQATRGSVRVSSGGARITKKKKTTN